MDEKIERAAAEIARDRSMTMDEAAEAIRLANRPGLKRAIEEQIAFMNRVRQLLHGPDMPT